MLVGDAVQVSTTSVVPLPVNPLAHGYWLIARTIAIPIFERTIPATTEYGFFHFSASITNSAFSRDLASFSSIPSMEATKGVQERRCWKQGYQILCFFTLCGRLQNLDRITVALFGSMVFVRRTSMMPSCWFPHKL